MTAFGGKADAPIIEKSQRQPAANGQKESVEIQKVDLVLMRGISRRVERSGSPRAPEFWSLLNQLRFSFSFRLLCVKIVLRKYHMCFCRVRGQSKFAKRDKPHT